MFRAGNRVEPPETSNVEMEETDPFVDPVEVVLKMWVLRQLRKRTCPDAAAIRLQARLVHGRIFADGDEGEEEFAADDDWLDGFMRRSGLWTKCEPTLDGDTERDIDALINNQITGKREICRMCLVSTAGYYSIFDRHQGEQFNIDEMISSVCSVEIQPCENLPLNICLDCYERLHCAYTVKKLCHSSESIIKSLKLDSMGFKDEPVVQTTEVENMIITPSLILLNEVDDEGSNSGDQKATKYTCKECQYSTDHKYTYQLHVDSHSSGKRYTCDICSRTVKSKKKLTSHIEKHNKRSRTYTTYDRCNFTTKKNESPPRPHFFACDKCDHVTKTKLALQSHLVKHSNNRRFMCGECGYAAKTKKYLKDHLIVHTTVRKFACDKCSYVAKTPTNLRRHTEQHTSEKSFMCDACGFTTKTKRCLEVHKRRHTAVGKYKCTLCPYTAREKYQLQLHVETHSTEKKYACDRCDYSTKTKACMWSHVKRLHATDAKLLSCDTCEYKTTSKREYQAHVNAHDDRRYSCDTCDYVAKTDGHLKRHVLMHSDP